MAEDIGNRIFKEAGAEGARDWTERVTRYGAVSEWLSALDDSQAMELLRKAAAATAGVGGITAKLMVDGVPVFVKQVPLTDLERRPENLGSTANIFQLPMFYQYGVGSAGFGAWREVAVHAMTTGWVLDNRFHGFPLLYHWRVLPQPVQRLEQTEVEQWVTHWEGADAVRARLQAINMASAAVVLFMEYIPHTVDNWLTAQTAAGGEAAEAAYTFTDLAMQEGVAFMEAQGLLHFDAHFRNLLTDGHRIYFADFGLAIHSQFDLTAAESAFLLRHRDYDRSYTATHLTYWLVSNLLKISWWDCPAYICERAPDFRNSGLFGSASHIVARHAPVAVVMGAFYTALEKTSKRTPFPSEDLERALAG